ncbi:hypothetical protein FB45DRAFT_924080 [Roridomyces roridus]|uniref:Fumarylacetoacetase-like C-terminal domain-containing protein n=1 Tax=Roridomyces roridus TaxID=1738132 RepID=A0AAD7BLX9_9AGAR|nr:hypothetical protein FB45DRAFT_924080 [Roridomyces roridus]
MALPWKRLIRFIPRSSSPRPLIGQPVDINQDVGIASRNGDEIKVEVFDGSSVLDAGKPTGKIELVERLLSPLASNEVGSIRCIGLNYQQHAEEAKIDIPKVPVLFMKPATALGDPFPAPTIIPKFTIQHQTADWESELAVVIGKTAKDVSEADALDYVLGYTGSNDVSSRKSQFEQSQWCFSKGFDGSCPIGPAIVSTELVPDVKKLHMRGLKNGQVKQSTSLDDLIFSVPKLVSFLSQGTTLPPGTIILTGTPSGVGGLGDPKDNLVDGDEFSVEVLPWVGTLVSRFEYEK